MRLIAAEPVSDRAGFLLAVAVTGASTVLSFLAVRHVSPANLVMIYLLGVSYVASRATPKAAILASFLSVATFDFCFVPPGGTFLVEDAEYLFTFCVMLVVALLISTLTVRLREQSNARQRAALEVQFEKMRGDLLSSVSHDLRTPLASIEGAASGMLEQPDLSPQVRELAQTVVEESDRMARLIRNLLDMSRFAGGAVRLDLDWYSLQEIVETAISRTEQLFQQPVTASLPSDLPLMRLDGVLLEQAMINLLENAARHGGVGVRVNIEAFRDRERVVLRVADSGPGLQPGQGDEIFIKFRRTGKTGFGLGLAICRAVVEAHGGSIRAENAVTGGAVFSIQLPIAQEDSVV